MPPSGMNFNLAGYRDGKFRGRYDGFAVDFCMGPACFSMITLYLPDVGTGIRKSTPYGQARNTDKRRLPAGNALK